MTKNWRPFAKSFATNINDFRKNYKRKINYGQLFEKTKPRNSFHREMNFSIAPFAFSDCRDILNKKESMGMV